MDIYTGFAVTGLIITLIFTGIAVFKNRKREKPNAVFSATGSFIEKYAYVFLFLIFAVYLISRLLKLDSYPGGIHVDELSMAVDAKSLLLNGTDRWGAHYPPYTRNYGGGQNVLYTYIQAFILSFLPCTVTAFRLQAVFWGAVCLFTMYGISLEITGNKGYALMGPVLVTVLPVYIMSERWGLESYLLLPLSTVVIFFFIRAVKYDKTPDWILTGVSMGVSLYSYAVSYIIWPIFLLISGIYLLYLKKLKLSRVLEAGIPLGILAFPLILFQLVNLEIIEPLTLWISDYMPLPEHRERELGLSNIIKNVKFIKKLFLGGEALTYNSVKEFGTVYLFLLPFVIAGLIICIRETFLSVKEKRFSCHAPILFFWLAGTVFYFLVKQPNVNRVNELFMPFLIFIVIAVHSLVSKNGPALIFLTGWTGLSFVFFMYFYFRIMIPTYGLHELQTSPVPGKAIIRSEKQYLKDKDTHIYVQFEDAAISPEQQVFYFAAVPGDVYSDDDNTYGNVTAGLPEDFDGSENAVFIIGDKWGHIVSYLISLGYSADQTMPGYSILYRG